MEGNSNKVFEFVKSLVAAQKGVKSSSTSGDGEDKKVTTTYEDGSEETVNADGSKTVKSKDASGNTVTKQLSASGELLKEEIKTQAGEVNEKKYENGVLKEEKNTAGNKVSTITYENGQPKETIVKEGEKETVYGPDGEAGGKPSSVKDGNKATAFEYGEDGSVKSTTTEGDKITVEIKNGDKLMGSLIEENGVKTTKVVNEDGTFTETIEKDGAMTVNELAQNGTKLSQTKTVDGKEFKLDYDGDGNTKVVVQNGESIAVLAKKFGCSIQDIVNANPQALKGKAPNQYFLVGAEVKIPKELEADDKALQVEKQPMKQ